MSDETALRAAIQRDPEDDTARLAFADLLDGQETTWKECPVYASELAISRGKPFKHFHSCPACRGTGFVPDAGNADRAEFIRVQVELHNKPCSAFMYSCHENGSSRCECNDFGKFDALRARESALIAAHPEWRPKCPVCISRWGYIDNGPNAYEKWEACPRCSGTGRVGEFRRGFVEVVRVPTLATVFGEISAQGVGKPSKWSPTAWVRDELAPYLPHVREVWCGDATPWVSEPPVTYQWWDAASPNPDHEAGDVPTPVFDRMWAAAGKMMKHEHEDGRWLSWRTEAEAHEEHAGAVADVLRALLCGAG